MNKKFLSAILFGAFMVGSSVTFTGCIDNDEPAGIEELRGAKAELIKAKVAVEAANAAYVTAQAEKVKAEAANTAAQAEIIKAQAEAARLQNELLSIRNEEEKAKLEAELVRIQQQMEEAALRHQENMLRYQQSLAEAQRAYEIALKQIEIAEALASEDVKVSIKALKLEVNQAQLDVDSRLEIVKINEKAYYEAVLDSKVDTVNFKSLELAVARKEAALKTAEETLAKWQGFLKNDTETATWREEITIIEDSVEGLSKTMTELDVKLTKLQNSDEYKALKAKAIETDNAFNNLKTTAKLSYKDLMNDEKVVAKGTAVTTALVDIAGANLDGKGGYIAYWNGKLAKYTTEYQAELDILAADYDKELAAAKKASDDAVKGWKDATAAYATAQAYTAWPTDLKAVSETAKKAYDDAMAAAAKLTVATERAKAEVKAQQAFADAIVKFYNAAATAITINKASLEITTTTGSTSKTTLVTKTVKEWLSDANNKDVYLAELIKYFGTVEAFWTVGTAEEVKNEAITKKAGAALGKIKLADDYKNELITASNKAFGPVSNYNGTNAYMLVEPTEAEVKAVDNYKDNAGAVGKYYWTALGTTAYEAKNYEAIMADYEKAVAYWTEQFTALAKIYTDAKNAKEAAAKAQSDYEKANFTAINNEIAVINDRINALNNVKSSLLNAVNTWLNVDEQYQNADKFATWLNKQAQIAEDAVIEAEKEVVRAENNLIEAKDGKYDALSSAKEALDKSMAELEKAQARLETAMANLQKGLAIFAGTAAE